MQWLASFGTSAGAQRGAYSGRTGAAADPDPGRDTKGAGCVRDAAKAASVVGFCIYTSVSGLAASVEAKKEPIAQPQQKTEIDSLHTMH